MAQILETYNQTLDTANCGVCIAAHPLDDDAALAELTTPKSMRGPGLLSALSLKDIL